MRLVLNIACLLLARSAGLTVRDKEDDLSGRAWRQICPRSVGNAMIWAGVVSSGINTRHINVSRCSPTGGLPEDQRSACYGAQNNCGKKLSKVTDFNSILAKGKPEDDIKYTTVY